MPITDFTQDILADAQQIEKRGVIDTEFKFGFRNLSRADYKTRSQLIDAIRELYKLALGPAECLFSL